MQPFQELPTIGVVASLEELDPVSYFLFNPDVAGSGIAAQEHLVRYGKSEQRRQFVNTVAITEIRREKLASLAYLDDVSALTDEHGVIDCLSKSVKDSFEIPEQPPIAANDYNSEIIALIRANPDKMFLDVGAGLRHTYYSNVVNAEIWRAASTDVVCVGESLPFANDQFDFVVCFAVLEHTRRPWLAAQEIIRVVKPGGEIRIDWPFLQPVHGYPHHFYNATPKGHTSMFEERCDIVACDVRLWQHPIFALTWMLNEWRAGLPAALHESFDSVTLGSLLGAAESHLGNPICAQLGTAAQNVIAAGTTLIARKRR